MGGSFSQYDAAESSMVPDSNFTVKEIFSQMLGEYSFGNASNISANNMVEKFIEEEFKRIASKQQALAEPFYLLMIVLFVITFLGALFGNVVVCFAIKATWNARNSAHRSLFLNLIICDLLIVLIMIPLTCAQFVDTRWYLGTFACKLKNAMSLILMCCSVYTLTGLSWLRSHIGVFKPFGSNRRRSRIVTKKELFSLIIIWCLAILIAIPVIIVSESSQAEFVIFGYRFKPQGYYICVENWQNSLKYFVEINNTDEQYQSLLEMESDAKFYYALIILILVFIIPLLVLGAAYFRICRAIYLSNKLFNNYREQIPLQDSLRMRTCESTSTNDNTSKPTSIPQSSSLLAINRRKNFNPSKRLFYLAVALVVIFAALWLPVQVAILIGSFNERHNFSSDSHAYQAGIHKLLMVFHWLALSNCFINPYFILATHSAYRKRFLRFLNTSAFCKWLTSCSCRMQRHKHATYNIAFRF